MKLLEITVKCKACGKDLILDKEHHRVVRENTRVGGLSFNVIMEPQLYDAFDCDVCGCQIIIGERKRNATLSAIDSDIIEEDMAEDEDPKDGANSSPDGYAYDYEREDILKKIAEAGEENE